MEQNQQEKNNMSKENNQQQEDFLPDLLMRCEERSVKRAKLNDTVRQAYVKIAEAKMLLFAQHGSNSFVEFVDSVKFGQQDSDDDEEEHENDDTKKKNHNENRVSREAGVKLEVQSENETSSSSSSMNVVAKNDSDLLSEEDRERALKVLSKDSLKAIQESFREIIVRAVDLGQS